LSRSLTDGAARANLYTYWYLSSLLSGSDAARGARRLSAVVIAARRMPWLLARRLHGTKTLLVAAFIGSWALNHVPNLEVALVSLIMETAVGYVLRCIRNTDCRPPFAPMPCSGALDSAWRFLSGNLRSRWCMPPPRNATCGVELVLRRSDAENTAQQLR